MLPSNAGSFLDRLQSACLIVGVHERAQHCGLCEGCLHSCRADLPLWAGPNECVGEQTLLSQTLQGSQDGWVLNLTADTSRNSGCCLWCAAQGGSSALESSGSADHA